MAIFHSYVNVYQRVAQFDTAIFTINRDVYGCMMMYGDGLAMVSQFSTSSIFSILCF